MKSKSAVLTEFKKDLEIQEIEVQPLAEGEVLVRLSASGVCGSDVHMWQGEDPRIKLPMVLGHEGVGIVEDLKGNVEDIFGKQIRKGDFISWDRSLVCGSCYYCSVKKEPSLCVNRQVYGISFSLNDYPYLNGGYSEYIHLRKNTKIVKIKEEIDAASLVTASCSGATSAHAVELADIQMGDTVVIQGPGPLGLFSVAFAKERGASRIVVIGSSRSMDRLNLCKDFGATDIIVRDKMTLDENIDYIKSITNGYGAEVVIECSGSQRAVAEGIKLTAPLGKYVHPGIAVPVENVEVDIFTDIIRKNVSLIGVWVSNTNHYYTALKLILSKKYPFEKIITHKFELSKATEALLSIKNREALKAVIIS